MHVNPANAATGEAARIDQRERVGVFYWHEPRQLRERGKDSLALTQCSERNFANDGRMTANLALLEQLGQIAAPVTQVFDPD